MKHAQDVKIGCILMAAGNATRFGANKLCAVYAGRPLYEAALSAIPAPMLYRVAVVTQYQPIYDAAETMGFTALMNPAPERGISSTIRIGLGAMDGADAVMFMVTDQPRLKRSSIEGELEYYLAHRDSIIAMACGEKRGNPTVFPGKYFAELSALTGDAGGSFVMRAHPDAVLTYQTAAEELFDVDNKDDLLRLDLGK